MIILDSSFIVAYYNSNDQNHEKANEVMKYFTQEYEEIVISDYIFDECATVLILKLKDMHNVMKICEILREIMKIKIDEYTFNHAWEIFCKQEHTCLSFTDATIIAIAKNKKMAVATFDQDFRKIKGIQVIPE